MELKLNYGDLSGAIRASNSLADELNQYCDNLSKKVQEKMYDVTGGMSSALNDADYYVKAKITQLRKKETNARDLSMRTQTLLDTAKRVDGEVKSMIEAEKKAFFQKNPDMKASDIRLAFTAFLCNKKNSPTMLGLLIKFEEAKLDAFNELARTIKHWWECGGGKEGVMNSVDCALKWGLAVIAVAVAIPLFAAALEGTTVIAVVVAAAAVIAAGIAVVNAGVNTKTSVQAIMASSKDPAMAKIYGERDTAAQALREHNFHDSKGNNFSFKMASGIEIADAAAGIILIIYSFGNMADAYLKTHGMEMAFKETITLRKGGTADRVTLKSIRQGIHALRFDEKIMSSDPAGFRTMLTTSLKGSWGSLKGSWSTVRQSSMTTIKHPVQPLKQFVGKELRAFDNNVSKFDDFIQNPRGGISSVNLQINTWINEFKAGNWTVRAKKAEILATNVNKVVVNANMIIKGLDRTDGKGLARLTVEKYAKDKIVFKKGSIFNLTNKIGLNGLITKKLPPELSDELKGIFTNSTKGIWDRCIDIHDSGKIYSFEGLYPYYKHEDEDSKDEAVGDAA